MLFIGKNDRPRRACHWLVMITAVTVTACNPIVHSASSGSNESMLLTWQPPAIRANGSAILAGEISYYEIRYKHNTDPEFHTLKASHTGDQSARQAFELTQLSTTGHYVIEVAAVDSEGLYSQFVVASPR